jgi:hypothetical protein
MKKLAILSILLYATLNVSAQSSAKYTYLVVSIPRTYNEGIDSFYSIIRAENGSLYASEVYSLKPFNSSQDFLGTMENFYSRRADTSKVFFNFFRNTTEAILFLSEHGWELVSVNNNIRSSTETSESSGLYIPYTTIEASPVYYFRKAIR